MTISGATRHRELESQEHHCPGASRGFVTNVALRKGARATGAPVRPSLTPPAQALPSRSRSPMAVTIAPGQTAELAFKFAPGEIHHGQGQTVVEANIEWPGRSNRPRGNPDPDQWHSPSSRRRPRRPGLCAELARWAPLERARSTPIGAPSAGPFARSCCGMMSIVDYVNPY